MNSRFLDFSEHSDYITNRYQNVKLTERKTVSIGNISGEEITYDKLWNPGADEKPKIVTEVYFNNDGNLWNILMMSDNVTSEVDRNYFKHVLDTFDILN